MFAYDGTVAGAAVRAGLVLLLGVAAPGWAAADAPPALAEVVVERFDRGERTERLLPGDWIAVHLPDKCYPYRGGKRLRFEESDLGVTVRVDGGPPELAGVLADSPENVLKVKAALGAGHKRFVIWCRGDLLADLPPTPEGTELALQVLQGRLKSPASRGG